jgi:multiple sugar transport system substrate-binding protein
MEAVTRRSLITRGAATLAVGALGVAPLAGCGVGGGSGERGGAGQRGALAPAQLRFTYWAAPDQVALYERFGARFAEQHPGVTLSFELTPFNEYFTKLLTQVSSGTPPDVGWHHSSQIQLHIVRGAVAALDGQVQRAPIPSDFYSLAHYQRGGKTYGVPWDNSVLINYYNLDAFRKAGVKTPTEWAKEGKWTWGQFLATGQQLTQAMSGPPRVWPVERLGPNVQRLYEFVRTFGGNLLSADRRQSTIDDPKAVEAIQFVADLHARHRVAPNPDDLAQSPAAFPNGTAAMQFNYHATHFTFKQVKAPDFAWDVAPPPKNTKVTTRAGSGYTIPTGSKHPDHGWAVIRFLSSDEVLRAIGESARSVPPRKSMARYAIPADGVPSYFKEAFIDASEQAEPVPFTPATPEIEQLMIRELEPVWLGRRSAQDAARNAAPAINAILARAR